MKTNLNKSERESGSNGGEVDRVVAAMKMKQGKSYIRNVVIILPQHYVVFTFTDDSLEGAVSIVLQYSDVIEHLK